MEKFEVLVRDHVVACSFRDCANNFSWAFVGVYGPNLDPLRRNLWNELAGLLSLWNLPWRIGGDFNVIRFPCER